MRRLAVLACLVVCGGIAQADVPPGAACGLAGQAAEKTAAVPANLLISIGMVESGRADPLTGRRAPWPWTVNADGQGQYFPTKEAAEEFVRLAESSGAHDIDVGCFQISLQAHPDAFASLDDAFDPAENASYAASFLTHLKSQTGSWSSAVADYHSALPDLGLPYERQVLAAWKSMGSIPFILGDDLTQVALVEPDPVVIMQSAAARSVHVYSMMDDGSAPPPSPGMPHVIYGD